MEKKLNILEKKLTAILESTCQFGFNQHKNLNQEHVFFFELFPSEIG